MNIIKILKQNSLRRILHKKFSSLKQVIVALNPKILWLEGKVKGWVYMIFYIHFNQTLKALLIKVIMLYKRLLQLTRRIVTWYYSPKSFIFDSIHNYGCFVYRYKYINQILCLVSSWFWLFVQADLFLNILKRRTLLLYLLKLHSSVKS